MEKNASILVVDDDKEIADLVEIYLVNDGYQVLKASDGEQCLQTLKEHPEVRMLILDIMMPKMDGFKACRQIREVTNAPILFLTAKTMDQDKALGFSSGGDDYLAKPFSYNELIARVKALLRRYCIYKGKEEPQEGDQIIMHDLVISRNSNQVKKKEEAVNLTEMEYQILLLLADHPKKIFSNQELYEAIWKGPYMYSANNTIMVHIRNLRKKLGVDPQNPVYIKTVWGKGYRFD